MCVHCNNTVAIWILSLCLLIFARALQGYNAIAVAGHDTALVCYDRMGITQGPYNNMHLSCWNGDGTDAKPAGRRNYTECSQTLWPNGWGLPFGCGLDHSTTFCMRATVSL